MQQLTTNNEWRSTTQSWALVLLAFLLWIPSVAAQKTPSEAQLAHWLKRFPEADTNQDGQLTVAEADAFRKKLQRERVREGSGGAPRTFPVDPGWNQDEFPEHAVSLKTPEEIKEIYAKIIGPRQPAVVSFEKQENGVLRIVGTGHSFMAPGYRTLPIICGMAGFKQPLYTHTGGGITGSSRYKWEQENGIFQFNGKPTPKLLASIANAEWDAMMWGPYFNDRPEYYSCWIDFCLKYNLEMKFYLSDAWPQLYQLGENPKSEDFFTEEVIDQMGDEKRKIYIEIVEKLREDYPNRVFILPTSDAMVLAAKYQRQGKLPGIEGFHKVIGGKERSLWRDQLGHIGPGFDRLEGYVFYATLYGKSPEALGIWGTRNESDFPSAELDRIFRKIAWQAVTNHHLSGVRDDNGDGVKD